MSMSATDVGEFSQETAEPFRDTPAVPGIFPARMPIRGIPRRSPTTTCHSGRTTRCPAKWTCDGKSVDRRTGNPLTKSVDRRKRPDSIHPARTTAAPPTHNDANGQTLNYSDDALNRLTAPAPPAGNGVQSIPPSVPNSYRAGISLASGQTGVFCTGSSPADRLSFGPPRKSRGAGDRSPFPVNDIRLFPPRRWRGGKSGPLTS